MSVVPCASTRLLNEAGFKDHLSAQSTFFMRAKLLYDIGVEKVQVRLVQGSLFLSLSNVSRGADKDYRYWLANAARIVIRMGLHKQARAQGLDLPSRRVLRRIWWLTYSWDTLLALHGLDSVRRFHYTDFDTPGLTEDDFFEEDISPDVADLLSPITRIQKCFQIYGCKLLRLGKYFPASSFSLPK